MYQVRKKKSPNLSYKYLKRSQVSFSSVVFCCLLKIFTLTLSSHPDLWEVWNIIVLAHFGCLYLPLLQICAFKIRYWQSGKTSAAALKAGLEIHPPVGRVPAVPSLPPAAVGFGGSRGLCRLWSGRWRTFDSTAWLQPRREENGAKQENEVPPPVHSMAETTGGDGETVVSKGCLSSTITM